MTTINSRKDLENLVDKFKQEFIGLFDDRIHQLRAEIDQIYGKNLMEYKIEEDADPIHKSAFESAYQAYKDKDYVSAMKYLIDIRKDVTGNLKRAVFHLYWNCHVKVGLDKYEKLISRFENGTYQENLIDTLHDISNYLDNPARGRESAQREYHLNMDEKHWEYLNTVFLASEKFDNYVILLELYNSKEPGIFKEVAKLLKLEIGPDIFKIK